MTEITFSLLVPDPSWNQVILAELRQQYQIGLARLAPRIQAGVSRIWEHHLRAMPHYRSLIQGSLRVQLGLANPGLVHELMDEVVDDVLVTVQDNLNILAGIRVEALPEGVFDYLDRPGASYRYFSRRYRKVITIPWLDWLLTRGTLPMVIDSHFTPGRGGRTGGGIMTPRGQWSVPAEYAGIPSRNWWTNAFQNAEREIVELLEQEISSL